MMQHTEPNDRLNMAMSDAHGNISQLSNQELREVIATCEEFISEGTARIEDYEAFVLAQQELARRLWM